MNKTQRIAYILKRAWELAYDIAIRTMTIEEAQAEAWMKVGGSVKLMIQNGYLQSKNILSKEEIAETIDQAYDCDHNGSCFIPNWEYVSNAIYQKQQNKLLEVCNGE